MFLYNQTTTGSNALFGLSASNVAVVSGWTYTRVTMGDAGRTNGKTVTVGIGVEPTY
jgi:hypothetical protein